MVGEVDRRRWANVSWLAGFRRRPHAGADLAPQLLALAQRPVTVGELLSFVQAPELARPVLFHLCWHHQMLFDLNAPLRESTIMRAVPTGKEAMR